MSATFPTTSNPPPPVTVEPVNRLRTAGPIARWVIAGAAAVSTVGLATYIYRVDPNVSSAYPQCPLKLFTGIDCPGCGGLRATHSLLHGDIAGAIDHNVFAFVLLPIMAYIVLRWVIGQFGRELPSFPTPSFVRWAAPLALVLFTVVRNIPNTPFYFLASGLS